MADPLSHPSFLELDRAALGKGAPETAQHLKGCARCGAYTRAVLAEPPLPPWLGALRPRPRATRVPLQWLFAGGLAVAVVLVAGLWLGPTKTFNARPVGPLVASKGSPTVALYIQRDERVFLWDGRSPLRVGDHIQMEVAAGGFSQLAVASTGGDPALLFAGPIDAARPVMLSRSFLVDARPGPERLVLGLSRQELTLDALVAAGAAHRRDASVWTTELVLTKEAPRDPSR